MERTAKHTIHLHLKGHDKARIIGPGESFEAPKEIMLDLDRKGVLKESAAKGRAAAEGLKKPKGKDLTAAIVGAIGGLDKSEDFTKSGDPSVPGLEKALGYPITAAERNAGWEAYKAANPDLFRE